MGCLGSCAPAWRPAPPSEPASCVSCREPFIRPGPPAAVLLLHGEEAQGRAAASRPGAEQAASKAVLDPAAEEEPTRRGPLWRHLQQVTSQAFTPGDMTPPTHQVCQSIHLSTHPSYLHPSIYHLSIHPSFSLCLSISSSIHLYFYPPIHPSSIYPLFLPHCCHDSGVPGVE